MNGNLLKNIFVQTQNAKSFITAMKEAERAAGEPRLLVFWGQAGRGKTTAARFFSAQEGWTYCRAKTLWSELWMLQDLCFELKVDPVPKRKKPCFEAIVARLEDDPDTVIVLDEADKVSASALEVIRDLADITCVPWALVGEKLIMHKMKRERRIWSRTLKAVGFGPISAVDVLYFAKEAAGLKLSAAQGKRIEEAAEGDFRLVVRDIRRIKEIMIASGHNDPNDDVIKRALAQGLRGN